MDEVFLDKLANGMAGAAVFGATSAGFTVLPGILEGITAAIGAALYFKQKRNGEFKSVFCAVRDAIYEEFQNWEASNSSSSRDQGEIASAIASVEEVMPHCLPSPREVVELDRDPTRLSAMMLERAANVEKFGRKLTSENDLARTLFTRIATRGFEQLIADKRFVDSLAPAMRDALRYDIQGLCACAKEAERQLNQIEDKIDQIAAKIDKLLDENNAASPEEFEREQQVRNLLEIILDKNVPNNLVSRTVTDAISRVQDMQQQLGGLPKAASAERQKLYNEASAALKLFDFATAESAWREYRQLGRKERSDRARVDAKADAVETGRIADTLRGSLRYREAAEHYAEAAATIIHVDTAEHYEWLYKEWNSLYELGSSFGDNQALETAIACARTMLTTDISPALFARTQTALGLTLGVLGERESGTDLLEQAVKAHRSVLKATLTYSDEWAVAQSNIGNTLRAIGERRSDVSNFEAALEAFQAALKVHTKAHNPYNWASVKNNMGITFWRLAERDGKNESFKAAVSTFLDVLEFRTRGRDSYEWAMTQNNLGNTLASWGQAETSPLKLKQAVLALSQALIGRPRRDFPLLWAMTKSDLGNTLQLLGQRELGVRRIRAAVSALRESLQERTVERSPFDWARTQDNLSIALHLLGKRTGSVTVLRDAVKAAKDSLLERPQSLVPLEWANSQNSLGAALWTLGETTNEVEVLDQALEAFRAALAEWTEKRVPFGWAGLQMNIGGVLYTIAEQRNDLAQANAALEASRKARAVFETAGASHYLKLVDGNIARTTALRDRLRDQGG